MVCVYPRHKHVLNERKIRLQGKDDVEATSQAAFTYLVLTVTPMLQSLTNCANKTKRATGNP